MNLLRRVTLAVGMLFAAEGHSAGSSTSPLVGDFTLSGVSLEQSRYKGEPAFRMTMPSEAIQDPQKEKLADRDFMAWLPSDFGDGVIEVEVASELVENAPAYARGFVGLTFRIDKDGRFESIYLRPTNSRRTVRCAATTVSSMSHFLTIVSTG